MRILGEEGINEFCSASPERRDELLAGLAAEKHRPARLLPWCELCSYVHATARRGQLDVDAFRACWSDLVALHTDMRTAGFLLRVGDWELDEEALLPTVYELERPPRYEPSPGRDDREPNDDWKEEVLRGRLQDFQERVIPRLREHFKDEKHRRRYVRPPRELPADQYLEQPDTTDIVLDTNVMVELLNVLPVRVQSGTRPDLSALGEPFRTRLSPALSRGTGKLIVPVSVLIETEGVIAVKVDRYQRADKVLRRMAAWPQQSQAPAFSFETISRDTFGAFLRLVECLVKASVPVESWPRLGDSLVLAHGIANGCPVASYEWIHKDEWRRTQLDQAFPYLVLR